MDEIKTILKNQNKYYGINNNFTNNINKILKMLKDKDMIRFKFNTKNELIICCPINNNTFNLYISENDMDKFFMSISIQYIKIYNDSPNININRIIFNMIDFNLSDYYEFY